MPAHVIVNPYAGNRRAGACWPLVERRLREVNPDFHAHLTSRPGEATEVARRALLNGSDRILVMGGDGTLNEVVNGFFDGTRAVAPHATLGIIPIGTGTDFVRSLNLPRDPLQALESMSSATPQPVDVGRVWCTGDNGQPVTRYFINIADFGFGGAVANRVNHANKRFGGFLTFLGGLLVTLATYQNAQVRVRIDGAAEEAMVINSVTIANGQYFGGGMLVAPHARIDDGLFEIVIVGDVTRPEVLKNIPRLYRGTLAKHAKVRTLRARRLEATSTQQVLIEADGEAPGKLSAVFEIVPRAVKLLYNPSRNEYRRLA